MSERAADRLSVAVVAKKSRFLSGIFRMLFGDQSVQTPEDEIQVTDRETGAIVYREAIDEGPGVASAVQAFQDDLNRLDVAAFCEKYGIEGFPRT